MSQAALKQAGEIASQAELRQQLVDCIRMLERSDIIDYNGHCSIRLDDNRVLINIGSCQRSRLTVDDICTIDLEASQIEGKGNAPLERRIALAFDLTCFEVDRADIVHREPAALARPDVYEDAVVVQADAAMAVVVEVGRAS